MYQLKNNRVNINSSANVYIQSFIYILLILILTAEHNVFADTWGYAAGGSAWTEAGAKAGNGINACVWGKSMASNQAMYYPDQNIINQTNDAFFNPTIFIHDWKRKGEYCHKLYSIEIQPRGKGKCRDDGTGVFHRSFFGRCVQLTDEDVDFLVINGTKSTNKKDYDRWRTWIAALYTGKSDGKNSDISSDPSLKCIREGNKQEGEFFIGWYVDMMSDNRGGGPMDNDDIQNYGYQSCNIDYGTDELQKRKNDAQCCSSRFNPNDSYMSKKRYDSGYSDHFKTNYLQKVYDWTQDWIRNASEEDWSGEEHPCSIFLSYYESGLRACICSETCSTKKGGITMLEQNLCTLLPYAPTPPPFCVACRTEAPEAISIIAIPIQQINPSDGEFSTPNAPKIKVSATRSKGVEILEETSVILSKDGEEASFFNNKATAKLSIPIGSTQMCVSGKKQEINSPELIPYNDMCYDLPVWGKIKNITSQGTGSDKITFTIPNYDSNGDKTLTLSLNQTDPETGFQIVGFYGRKENGIYKIPVTYTCQEIQSSGITDNIVREYDATPTSDGKGLECTLPLLPPQNPFPSDPDSDELEIDSTDINNSITTTLQIVQKIPDPIAKYDQNYDTLMCVKGWRPESKEYFTTNDISIRVANNTNQFIPIMNKNPQYCTEYEITKYVSPEYSMPGCLAYDIKSMSQKNLDLFKTKDGYQKIFFDNNEMCIYNYQPLINYQFETPATRKNNSKMQALQNSMHAFLTELNSNKEKSKKSNNSNSLTNEQKKEYELITSNAYNEFGVKSNMIRSSGGGSTIELYSTSENPGECIIEQQTKYGLDNGTSSDTIIDFSNFHYISGGIGFAPNFDDSGLIEIINPDDFDLCVLVKRYIDIPPEVGCVGDDILEIADDLDLPPIISIDIPGIDAEKCDNPNIEKPEGVVPMPIFINFDPIKTQTSTLILDNCEDKKEDDTSANTFTCVKKQILDTYVMDTIQDDGETPRCTNVYSMLSGSKIGGIGMMSEIFVRNSSPITIRKAPQNINYSNPEIEGVKVCKAINSSDDMFCNQCNINNIVDEKCCTNTETIQVCQKDNNEENTTKKCIKNSDNYACRHCCEKCDSTCQKYTTENDCTINNRILCGYTQTEGGETSCNNNQDNCNATEYRYFNPPLVESCCTWNITDNNTCISKPGYEKYNNECASCNTDTNCCNNVKKSRNEICTIENLNPGGCIITKYDASYLNNTLCDTNSTTAFFHNLGVSVSSYNANLAGDDTSIIPSMSSSAQDYKFSLCSSPFTYGYFNVEEQSDINQERYLVLVLGTSQKGRGLSYRATHPETDFDLYTGIKKPDWNVNKSTMLGDYSGIMNDAILSDADIKIKQKLCGFFNNVINKDDSKIVENMLLTRNFLSYDTSCFAPHPFNHLPTMWNIDKNNFQAESNSPFKDSIKTRFLHNSHLMTYLFACNNDTLRDIANLTQTETMLNISSKELKLDRLYKECKLIQYSGTTQESNYLQLMFPERADIVTNGDRKTGALIPTISSEKFKRSADFIYNKDIWSPFSMISDSQQSDPLAVGRYNGGFLNSTQNSNPALGGFYTANKLCQANSLLPALYEDNVNLTLYAPMKSIDIRMLLTQFDHIYVCNIDPSNTLCNTQNHQDILTKGYFKKFIANNEPNSISILNETSNLHNSAITNIGVAINDLEGNEGATLSNTIDLAVNRNYFTDITQGSHKLSRRQFNFYNNGPDDTLKHCNVKKPSSFNADTNWNWDRYVKSIILSTGLVKYKYNILDFFPYVSPGYYVFTSSHNDCDSIRDLSENSGLIQCACKNENASDVGVDITLNNNKVHQSIVQNTYISGAHQEGLPPGFAFMFCVIPDLSLPP